MKQSKALLFVAALSLAFAACTKDGDTINNYTTGGDQPAPAKKLLKEYVQGDTANRYVFKYYNNDPDKLQEISLISNSVPNGKVVFLYNSAGKPEGYQIYSLPANTLTGQGTFKIDSKDRVIEAVTRQANGDTNTILYLQYEGAAYQPVLVNTYDKSNDRITSSAFIRYDNSGNVSKMMTYEDDGSSTRLSGETEVVPGKAINPLPRIYYLLMLQSLVNSATPVYLSNYVPYSASTQNYNADGSKGSVSLQSYVCDTDADGHAVNIKDVSGNLLVAFKY